MRLLKAIGRCTWRFVHWELRVLLPLVLVGLVALIVVYWYPLMDAANTARWMWDAANFATKMDKAYDQLPPIPLRLNNDQYPIVSEDYGGLFSCWGMMTNSEMLCKFTLEAVPYFSYEGPDGDYESFLPLTVVFVPYGGMEHFHILGMASCTWATAGMNYRMMNYASPWQDADSLLSSLVHELGHTQGVCGTPAEVMEMSNQLLTIEILAGMANHSNHYAVKPLVKELRDFADDYLMSKFYGTRWYPLYEFWANHTLYTTFEEQSRHAKSMRFWIDKPDELRSILTAYGAMPFQYMTVALRRPDYQTDKLLLWEWGQKLVMNDLAYFLEHLEDHIKNAQNGEY